MKNALRKPMKTLSRIFLQGLAVILPIIITISIVYWLAATAETHLGGLVKLMFPGWRYWTGLGVALGIVLVFAVGLLMNAWIMRKFVSWAESLMERIPLVKTIYGSVRDLARFLSGDTAGKGFHQVVAVTVGDRIRLVGFVTLDNFAGLSGPSRAPEELVGVYLPMSYQIGGYTVFVPKSAIEPVDMTMEDAMRFTLTAGMSLPEKSRKNADALSAGKGPAGK